MPALAEPPPASGVSDAVKAFVQVLKQGDVAQVEAVIAFLALYVAEQVESGHIAPQDADWLFTRVDVQLTDFGRLEELSDEAAELILEAEHFHHHGGEWGVDLGRVRELAAIILARAGRQRSAVG
jgi:hypothetical protein